MFLEGFKLVLLSFIPALVYLGIIYITTPYRSWKFSRAIAYIGTGCFSAILALIFSAIPYLNKIPMFFSMEDPVLWLILLSFVQIALVEETSKLIIFKWTRNKLLPNHTDQTPLSIMIYCGCISFGFAFIENIFYGVKYGEYTLYWRSINAVLMHMLTGFFMGYWLSLSVYKYKSRMLTSIGKLSILDAIIFKFPRFRKIFYTFMGLFSAIFIHGLYDMNLIGVGTYFMDYKLFKEQSYYLAKLTSQINDNVSHVIMILILTLSIWGAKMMANHLIKLNYKLNKN